MRKENHCGISVAWLRNEGKKKKTKYESRLGGVLKGGERDTTYPNFTRATYLTPHLNANYDIYLTFIEFNYIINL